MIRKMDGTQEEYSFERYLYERGRGAQEAPGTALGGDIRATGPRGQSSGPGRASESPGEVSGGRPVWP